MKTTKTYSSITRRDGLAMWQMTERGPRGGARKWYAPRRVEETEPSAWVIWSERQGDVRDGDLVIAHDLFRVQ
jgi:hypothetical protein